MTILLMGFLWACKKDNTSVCRDDTAASSLSNYPLGTAVDVDLLDTDEAYRSKALLQFNSITAENCFKAEYLHPQPNTYEWEEADRLVSFCEQHNKRLFGHTLIWYKQLPQWILDFQGNAEEWDVLMKTHIQTIVTHFKSKVSAWDVVNEAFNEDGSLRNSIWKQHLGPGYIEKAFRYALEADPSALLFYNDYNLESNFTKRKAVIALVENLRNRGVRVDGIGLQMHISTSYPEASQIADALKDIAKYDLKIHISELDISINPLNQDIDPNDDLLMAQANVLGSLVFSYAQLPASLQFGITFWGISDRYSWIRTFYMREDYPLLYDDNFMPKPCYCKLIETL